jgi:hypothetical protein
MFVTLFSMVSPIALNLQICAHREHPLQKGADGRQPFLFFLAFLLFLDPDRQLSGRRHPGRPRIRIGFPAERPSGKDAGASK